MRLVNKKEINKSDYVYNLHVKNNHNYIISNAVVSNCHGAKGAVIQELINEYGSHISYRFGITGTMPKSEVDKITIESTIGPVLGETSTRWLIDNGYLAEVDINIIQTVEKADLPDYSAEKKFLAAKESRLELIADLVMENRDKHGNTLVLVSDIKFGKRLMKLIPDSVFMYGDTDTDTRAEHYDAFEENDGIIKICTLGIAKQGISIDRIFSMVLVDMPKSFIAAIQSIGRGLRMAEDKYKVWITDISATLKYSKKHLGARKKWYKEAEYPIVETKKIKY